jgi:hypothetical protein
MKNLRLLCPVRRAAALALLMLFLSARADADSIANFDFCTVASLCNKASFTAFIQPGGTLTTYYLGGPLAMVEVGINYLPSFEAGNFVFAPEMMPLGPGEIGPYGTFVQRWSSSTGGNIIEFRDPNGPITSDFAPFFENANGVFIAAQVRDINTGATGFVAATLNRDAPVPEPGTMLLFGSGLMIVAKRARRLVLSSRDRAS